MNKPKILISDDNEDFASWAQANLCRKGGYEAYIAKDGRESIDKVKELNPDVMLLDILMPEVSGIEVAREVRKFNTNIKIIFVTGFENPRYHEEALEYGISGYIVKPILWGDILQAVCRALNTDNCGLFACAG